MTRFLLQVAHVDIDGHTHVVVVFGLEGDPVILHAQHRVQLVRSDHLLDLALQLTVLLCYVQRLTCG